MPGLPWDYDETCFAAGLLAPEVPDSDPPPAGHGFYYLIGAVNACGESAIGMHGQGMEHFASPSCPQ